MDFTDDDFFPEDEAFLLIPGNEFRVETTKPAPGQKEKNIENGDNESSVRKRDNSLVIRIGWTEPELWALLQNYIEFHFFMVFERRAEERYRTEAHDHPYLKAFNEITDLNDSLLSQIRKLFFLDTATVLAITRHSLTWEQPHRNEAHGEERRMVRESRNTCCICYKFAILHEIHFMGPSYNRTYLEEQPNQEGHPESESFSYCKMHREAVSVYFALCHMRWNIFRNCEHQMRLLHSENAEKSSTELIEAVNPKLIKNLIKWYIHYYRSTEKLSRWIE